MKTNKLPRKGKFDAGLTIAGWVLAVFVSLLYLHEVTGSEATARQPQEASPAHLNLEISERIQNLLTEAIAAMLARQPEVAIQRVTTIWSVCSATRQEVPEETHHIFAQCVSQMAERNRNLTPPPPPSQGFRPGERSYHPEPATAPAPPPISSTSITSDSKSKAKCAEFKLPQSGYPKAKQQTSSSKPIPAQAASPKMDEGLEDIPVYNPEGRPPFPPRVGDRRGQQRHKPPRVNRPGEGFPGNRPGSFPPPPPGSGQFPPHPPLDSQDGGRPPGY